MRTPASLSSFMVRSLCLAVVVARFHRPPEFFVEGSDRYQDGDQFFSAILASRSFVPEIPAFLVIMPTAD